MYLLFYFWHGSVLNDFIRLEINLNLFYFLTAVVYFILGLIIMFLHRLDFFKYQIPTIFRIVLIGIIVGFGGYALSIVLPVSVERTLNFKYVLFDLFWQITEETVGSAVFYLSYRLLSYFSVPEFEE
ncbi:MAG: hypothetical protein N3F09_09935 [Bacteroidia bacterium]|nr:hypothetical protein [Bacteroidia bacterium]